LSNKGKEEDGGRVDIRTVFKALGTKISIRWPKEVDDFSQYIVQVKRVPDC
jgi:hypothetical protein